MTEFSKQTTNTVMC